jgi:hypothetical protein
MILSLLAVTLYFTACGERARTVTNANAGANSAVTGGGGNNSAGAGIGPENQGIGGTSEGNSNAVNGNTYTVPPGFNKNGDRGSASNVSSTP